MTFSHDDGSLCNLKLLPKNKMKDDALEFISSFVIPFGLVLSAGRVLQGTRFIPNLTRFVAANLGGKSVDDIFDRWRISDSAYYATDNGELVITHPIRA